MGKLIIRISQPARQDFAQLLAYSVRTWGEEQTDTYELDIIEAIESIGGNPEIGMARPTLFNGCRVFPAGHHVMYYRIVGQSVEVVRILHERQGITNQITDPD